MKFCHDDWWKNGNQNSSYFPDKSFKHVLEHKDFEGFGVWPQHKDTKLPFITYIDIWKDLKSINYYYKNKEMNKHIWPLEKAIYSPYDSFIVVPMRANEGVFSLLIGFFNRIKDGKKLKEFCEAISSSIYHYTPSVYDALLTDLRNEFNSEAKKIVKSGMDGYYALVKTFAETIEKLIKREDGLCQLILSRDRKNQNIWKPVGKKTLLTHLLEDDSLNFADEGKIVRLSPKCPLERQESCDCTVEEGWLYDFTRDEEIMVDTERKRNIFIFIPFQGFGEEESSIFLCTSLKKLSVQFRVWLGLICNNLSEHLGDLKKEMAKQKESIKDCLQKLSTQPNSIGTLSDLYSSIFLMREIIIYGLSKFSIDKSLDTANLAGEIKNWKEAWEEVIKEKNLKLFFTEKNAEDVSPFLRIKEYYVQLVALLNHSSTKEDKELIKTVSEGLAPLVEAVEYLGNVLGMEDGKGEFDEEEINKGLCGVFKEARSLYVFSDKGKEAREILSKSPEQISGSKLEKLRWLFPIQYESLKLKKAKVEVIDKMKEALQSTNLLFTLNYICRGNAFGKPVGYGFYKLTHHPYNRLAQAREDWNVVKPIFQQHGQERTIEKIERFLEKIKSAKDDKQKQSVVTKYFDKPFKDPRIIDNGSQAQKNKVIFCKEELLKEKWTLEIAENIEKIQYADIEELKGGLNDLLFTVATCPGKNKEKFLKLDFGTNKNWYELKIRIGDMGQGFDHSIKEAFEKQHELNKVKNRLEGYCPFWKITTCSDTIKEEYYVFSGEENKIENNRFFEERFKSIFKKEPSTGTIHELIFFYPKPKKSTGGKVKHA